MTTTPVAASARARVPRDELFASLSLRGRLLLIAAIFLTFAAIGPLMFLARTAVPDPWWSLPLWSLFSGGIALGWALSFLWRRWILPLVILTQLAFPFIAGAAIGHYWQFTDQRVLFAVLALVFVVSGYILMTVFVSREGSRRLRAEAELNLAQQIHRALVPPIETRIPLSASRSLLVYGRSDASSQMGGDLIDLIHHADGSVDLFLVDVSGHGVSAGIVMGMVKSAIRTRLMRPAPLAELITDVNAVIESLTEPNMFATLVCVRIRPDAAIEHVVAGHPPVLHVSPGSSTTTLDSQSLPLGIDAAEAFAAGAAALAPGDLLALYTDGLTESMNAASRQFGIDGVRDVVVRHRARPLADIAASMFAAARAHGPQTDDQTVLLVRLEA